MGHNYWLWLGLSILNAILLFFATTKFLLSMQQLGYKGYRYFKWMYSKRNPYLSRLMLLSLLGFLFFCILGITFARLAGGLDSFIGFFAYVFFMLVYIDMEKHVNVKLKLKKTKRLVRLAIVYLLVLAGVSFGLFALLDYIEVTLIYKAIKNGTMGYAGEVFGVLKYSLIALTPFLAPFLLSVGYYILKPFEDLNNKRYLKLSKRILGHSDAIKIGITGSYGKTSVKEILATILSVRYRVLATPESYNTPLGIAYAVKKLESTHDVFIAEMGAREVGDISDLANMVCPDIAVLTGLNSQHLESFKTIENIKNTKYELFENLKQNGKAFFNIDSPWAKELADKFSGEKYCVSLNGGFVSAKNLVYNNEGISFDLVIEGERPIKCSTTLIGEHSIANILLAAAVAYKLGLNRNEIFVGVTRLHSVKHRLQVLPTGSGVTLIDDSYNSNIDGFKCALKALSAFSGRKIIVTPGLVELGANQGVLNYEVGKLIASNCDVMIISAKTNAEMLIKGFVDGGKDTKDILYAKNHVKAKELLNNILQKGDVVLFENDLPDTYE